MFQVFNVTSLMRHAYQSDQDRGLVWQITRLFLPSGHEDDNTKWEVNLTDHHRELVVNWKRFLTEYRVIDDAAPNVGAFIFGKIDALEVELKRLGKRRWLHSLISRRALTAGMAEHLWRNGHPLRAWFLPSIVIEHRDLERNPEEVIKPLLAGLVADRHIATIATAKSKVETEPVRLSLPAAPADPKTYADQLISLQEDFTRGLEQSLGNSRHLLSLSNRFNHPASVESVLCSIVGCSMSGFILDLCNQSMPEVAVDVTAGLGEIPDHSELRGRLHRCAWDVSLPIWSTAVKTPVKAWTDIGVEPAGKGDRSRLEEILGVVAHLLNTWIERRQTPLAPGGGGWMGLLDHAEWNPDLFERWFATAPVEELMQRADAISHQPPASGEKKKAWEKLLQRIRQGSTELSLTGWALLLKRIDLWEAREQAELRSALREQAGKHIRETQVGSAQAATWLDLWFRSFGSAAPSERDVENLFALLTERCQARRTREDFDLLHHFWLQTGKLPGFVPVLARNLAGTGAAEIRLIHELAETLSPEDDRRLASSALLAGAEMLGPDQSNHQLLPLLVLGQPKAGHAGWQLDDSEKQKVTALIDQCINRLDRSQDLPHWKEILQHRQFLQKAGLYKE